MRYVMGEGGGCFPAGTMVSTPEGAKAIEKLQVGDEVLSYDFNGCIAVSKVQKVHTHAEERVLRITYWGGSLRVTANHWMLNQYNTFAHAVMLKDDDALVDGIGHLRPILGTHEDGREPVYNLTVFPNHTFIADNIRVHNGGRGLTSPVVGSGGGGGKGGGGARAAVEDPDSLQSHQYAKVIDLISEGEIGGLVNGLKSVFLDETPIQSPSGAMNFNGVEIDYRNGTNTQTPLPGFSDVENETAVGVEIKNGSPIVRSVSGDIDAARVTLGFPQLTKQDASTGDLHGASVNVSIEINNNGGGYRPVPLRYQWDSASPSGMTVVADNACGVSMTALLRCASQPSGRVETNVEYLPLEWRVEYKAPGGAWTQLKHETEPSWGMADYMVAEVALSGMGYTPKATSATPTSVAGQISRDYEVSYPNLFGQWQIRIVMISVGSAQVSAGGKLTVVDNDDITGKTTSRYRRSYYIPLPEPGPWDIRVTRNTPTTVDSSLRNESWWDSLTEVVESKLSYPNSAIIGLKIDAEQFSSIPTRGYEIFGILCKVPSNYDPIARTYSGIWDGTFQPQRWTDNPAWVYYDLATTGRYGLGDYIDAAGVDKWALYEIAKYCDEMVPSGYGYVEPRFTCNAYIQTRQDAYKLMCSLASVFRGMSYWSAGQVTAVADMPAEPVALFTNANVIDGVFTYSGSSRGARHTVALVTWNDPQDMYRQKVEYVDDEDGIAKYGVNQTEVVAFACSSRGQARRMGKWILYTERLESEAVSWKTGLEGTTAYLGAIVKIADNLRSGDRIGGRCLASTINTITIDSPVTLEVGLTYTLSVMMPDGTLVDRAVSNAPGTTSQLTVYPNFPAIPQQYAMWVIASENLNPQTVRVLSVTESSATQVEITALQHDPRKFEMIEYDRHFDPIKTSSISLDGPSVPTNLTATDVPYYQGGNLAGTKVTFSWTSKAPSFEVRWRKGDDNYVTIPSITATSVDIEIINTLAGTLILEVRAIDALGRRSQPERLRYEGKNEASGDIDQTPISTPDITVTVDSFGIATLTFNAISDPSLTGYELRSGPSFLLGTTIATTTGNTFKLPVLSLVGLTLWIHGMYVSGGYTATGYSINFGTAKLSEIQNVSWKVIEPALSFTWDAVVGASQYVAVFEDGGVSRITVVTAPGVVFPIPKWPNAIFRVFAVATDGGLSPYYDMGINITGVYNYNELLNIELPITTGQYVNLAFTSNNEVKRVSLLGSNPVAPYVENINDADLYSFGYNLQNLAASNIATTPAAWFRGSFWKEKNGFFESGVLDLGAIYSGKLLLNLTKAVNYAGAGAVSNFGHVRAEYMVDALPQEIMDTKAFLTARLLVASDSPNSSSWVEVKNGDWVTAVQYVKLVIDVAMAGPLTDITITAARVCLDVPDLSETGSVTGVTSSGKAITFTKPFHVVSCVLPVTRGSAKAYASGVSPNGCTFYVDTGTQQVDYFVKGY